MITGREKAVIGLLWCRFCGTRKLHAVRDPHGGVGAAHARRVASDLPARPDHQIPGGEGGVRAEGDQGDKGEGGSRKEGGVRGGGWRGRKAALTPLAMT